MKTEKEFKELNPADVENYSIKKKLLLISEYTDIILRLKNDEWILFLVQDIKDKVYLDLSRRFKSKYFCEKLSALILDDLQNRITEIVLNESDIFLKDFNKLIKFSPEEIDNFLNKNFYGED